MKFSLLSILILFFSFSALAQSSSQQFSIWGNLLGTNPVIEGPNCWNLALVDIGITAHKRFSSSQEFRESLSAFCKPIPVQLIKQGDVGAITYDEAYELHAFIVIDKQRALTKDFGSDDPNENISYRIENIKQVVAPYMKSNETSHLQYYRCDREKIFLMNQSLAAKLPSLAQALKQSEEVLEKYHWNQARAEDVMSSLLKLNQELESAASQNLLQDLETRKILRLRILGYSEGVLSLPTNADGARLKENLAKWTTSL